MSDIFVTGPPKMIGTGDPDSNGTTFFHSIITPTWNDTIQKVFTSPISAARTVKTKGIHASFDIVVFAYKYTLNPPYPADEYQTAKAFATWLLKYIDKDVQFYPFYDVSDAKILKDSSSNIITCHVMSIDFDWLKKPSNEYDIIRVTLQTNSPYDISKIIKA